MLPRIVTHPPGPESRRLAEDLARFEAPAVSGICTGDIPIVWARARDANVTDADGNVYIDMTAGFGVASLGHANPRVMAAVRRQSRALVHSLGDVHPNGLRVALVKRLTEMAPGTASKAVLLNTGADAVEFALKTAVLHTGKTGVLAFEGGFHGQSYGALAVTHRESFRGPFKDQIFQGVARSPFPYSYRRPNAMSIERHTEACLDTVERLLENPPEDVGPIGAAIVEPVQGREGEIVPPAGFLPGLKERCARRGVLLILDELITGFGRTGKRFAAEHWGIEPDLLCAGKALANGLPISACTGRAEVMDAWRYEEGEAPHSSTFMGNPLAAAAALATLDEHERLDLPQRAEKMGAYATRRLRSLEQAHPLIGDVRGLGLMLGIELVRDPDTKEPATMEARRVVEAALLHGVILLAGGPHGNVLSLTPPLTIPRRELDYAIDTIDACLRTVR